MTLIPFLLKSLFISLHVGIRMIPVLGITFYSIYMLFLFFAESELAIFLIGIALYMPLLMFLYLCSVRAGLAALKATTAPAFGKLFKGAIRLMRFHFMISNLVMSVVGIGGAGLVIWFTNPVLIDLFSSDADRAVLFEIDTLINEFSNIPAFILIFPPLAICIAAGLVGTSLGATAAWAAERGPEHDLIWGITDQFSHVFCAAALALLGPMAMLIISLGGPFASIWNVLFLSTEAALLYGFLSLWSISFVAAAMALAYVKNLKDLEAKKEAMEAELMGEAYNATSLRELRLARQSKTQMVAAE